MALTEKILAALLALQAPGRTTYSTVLLASCDAQCQAARPCAEDTILCTAPRYSPAQHQWWRYEQPDEGRVRYAIIAQAIADVAGPEGWPYVATVAYHESGFRRDVHSGVGRWARGDGGRSWCLGQIMLDRAGRVTAPRAGFTGPELVGLDLASTRRCVSTVWRYLSEAIQACAGVACIFSRYGGLSGPDARIASRVTTFEKLRVLASTPAAVGGAP